MISPKYMVCNSRYSAGNLLTNDNGADWYNIGNLWVLTEEELTGKSIYGTTGVNHGGGAVQYPLFAGNSAGKYVAYGSTRSYRRLFNAPSGSSASFITIDPKGDIYYEACSSTRRYQPCFRIMAD